MWLNIVNEGRFKFDCGPGMGLSHLLTLVSNYAIHMAALQIYIHQLANTSDNPPLAVPSLISTTAHTG